jgi:hypothetical protein
MKLEIEKVTPYLPYGLKYLDKDTNELTVMRSISTEINLIDMGWGNAHDLKEFKPILNPLSYFKEVIIKDIRIDLELSHNQTMEFLGFMDGVINLENITLGLYYAMCKKHIDFNRLIEAGLAIDINTLEQ